MTESVEKSREQLYTIQLQLLWHELVISSKSFYVLGEENAIIPKNSHAGKTTDIGLKIILKKKEVLKSALIRLKWDSHLPQKVVLFASIKAL